MSCTKTLSFAGETRVSFMTAVNTLAYNALERVMALVLEGTQSAGRSSSKAPPQPSPRREGEDPPQPSLPREGVVVPNTGISCCSPSVKSALFAIILHIRVVVSVGAFTGKVTFQVSPALRADV